MKFEELLPHWASGKTDGCYTQPLATLPTRDGRKMGNATNTGLCVFSERLDKFIYTVVTDAGNTIRCTEGELVELFYPPTYVKTLMLFREGAKFFEARIVQDEYVVQELSEDKFYGRLVEEYDR